MPPEGPDFAPSCCAGDPVRHMLSLWTRWPRAGQSGRSTCLFGLCCLGCALGAWRCPAAPCQCQQGSRHVPAAGGVLIMPRAPCYLTGLSLLVHPLEVALRCNSHRARRRGLVRGHRGEELRMAAGWPHGSCLSAANGLPWGSADPFPWTRSCRNTDAFSARGAGFPS